jgi:mannosyltransferase
VNNIQYRIESFFENTSRKPFWFLASLVVVNIALKFFQVSDASIWLDEAHTANQALKSISEIISDSAKDQNPPLYFMVMHFWIKVFGISESGIRSFSILMSVITIPVLFYFAKENFNTKAAVIASVLFTFSEQQIYFSLEARTYAFTGLLCIISFLLFFRLIKKPSVPVSLLLGFVNSLLIYSHFISCFIIVVEIVCLFILLIKGDRKVFLYGILSLLLTVLLFIPWIGNLFKNIPKSGEYWLAKPSFYNLKGLFISFSNGKISTVVFAMLICLFVYFTRKKYFKKNQSAKNYVGGLVLLLWFLLPVFADYLISGITPIFLNKYLLYSSIALYLLIGVSLSVLPIPGFYKSMVAALVLILFIVNTKIKARKPEDWRSAAEFVRSKQSSQDVAILSAACVNMPFSYYYDKNIFKNYDERDKLLNERKIFSTDKLNEEMMEEINPQNKIILIESHLDSQSEDAVLKILEEKFRIMESKDFGDIHVSVFRKWGG